MKLLCCIFSIYILSLLAVPCQDNGDTLFSDKTERSANHSHNDNDCHGCTPFCICNCCHVNTIIVLNVFINTAETVPTLFKSIYCEASVKDVIFAIWQPPKI